ncbi:MAG: hypothetical protein MK132_04095 [Lentisphaerales bacterium]|nr:hypothetical protein [Lentisphaerales bacterium]
MILLLLAVVYFYNFVNVHLEEVHEVILEEEVAIKSHSLHVQSKMIEAERDENDFLMRQSVWKSAIKLW